MSMCKAIAAALVLCASAAASQAGEQTSGVGTPVSAEELAKFFAIQPGGIGLPAGKGTVSEGRQTYADRCAACHGEELEGIKEMAGPALAGGRGSLATDKPLKTVESYWPQASTLYDYIWRAMPFDQPGSLTADEVYGLVAYILSEGKVTTGDKPMDADALSKVVMPNANGFYVSSGPDLQIYKAHAAPAEKRMEK
ncbi:c-type cytochrome [Hyphomicrobium sp.]|uniref:c-type cytochrome n=1 Tax=Hyphomicrobium sp. TaxID=82 RepID=UPI003F730161